MSAISAAISNGGLADPDDVSVRLLDLRSGQEVTRFTGMQRSAHHVSFLPLGTAATEGRRPASVLALAATVLREWTLVAEPER